MGLEECLGYLSIEIMPKGVSLAVGLAGGALGGGLTMPLRGNFR